jgi:hypothetical protein
MPDDDQRITRRGPGQRTWYQVATAGGEAEAALIKGLLESNGIPVWVYFESAGRAIGLGVGPLGATYLYTTAEYYEDALDLLADDGSPELDEGYIDLGEDADDDQSPNELYPDEAR